MANDYFNHDTKLVAGARARSSDVNDRFDAVVAGFDKLPDPTTGGFLDPVVVGDAVSEDHAATARQVRDGVLTYAIDSGAANAMTVSLAQPPAAYTAGLTLNVKVAYTNTGATTINVDGLGARPVRRVNLDALSAGDIAAGRVVGLRYDGTYFILLDGTYAVHNHDDLYYRPSQISSLISTSNAATATKLMTARTITLSGDVSGSTSFDGSANKTITVAVNDDSHNHVIANVDGLQTALDGKVDYSALGTLTAAISTSGFVTAGRGSGGVSLTNNDSYGNANVTFNHANGTPEQNGNAARIHVNTDETSGAYIQFKLKSGVTSGVADALTATMMIYEDRATFLGNTMWHAGNDGSGSGLDADKVDGFDASATPAASTVAVAGTDGLLDPAWQNQYTARVIRRQSLDRQPTLDLDFMTQTFRVKSGAAGLSVPQALADISTFTRSTTGTYFDHNGVLKTAAINTPRIDYDPETGECLGFLSEPERTNLVQYSEDFTNSYWAKALTAVSASSEVSPDGGINAGKFTEAAAYGAHQVTKAYTATFGINYIFSIFAKALERDKFVLVCPGTGINCIFNLATGIAYPGTNATAYGIKELKNGWFHCFVGGPSDGTNNFLYIKLANAAGSTNYVGDGTSGMLFFGAQFEEGYYPTSYIKTTTAAATRSNDLLVFNSISNWYRDNWWTTLMEYDTKYIIDPNYIHRLAQFYNASTNERLSFNLNANGRVNLYHSATATGITIGTYTPTEANVKRLAAFALYGSNAQCAEGGILSALRTNMPHPADGVVDTFSIGSPNETPYAVGGHMQRVLFYPGIFDSEIMRQLTL